MKKLSMMLLCMNVMLLYAMNSYAQEAPNYRHSISAGIGLWPNIVHYDPYYDEAKNLYDEETNYSSIPNVSYQYKMNRHWSMGGTVSLIKWNQKMRYIDSREVADEEKATSLSLLFTTRYYWRTKNWVRTYSGASLGIGFSWKKEFEHSEDKLYLYPSGHITVLGVEVGKGHLFGYGEFGLGVTGWLQGGVGYRF